MMKNLFVYGALMYEEVWNRIVTGEFKKTDGVLSGYRRLAVKDEEYPGLVKAGGWVKGCIWYDVDTQNLGKLDIFEGEYYERIPLVAVDDKSNDVVVDVYCFRKKFLYLLESHEWDVKKFEKSGLKKFTSRYLGFSRL